MKPDASAIKTSRPPGIATSSHGAGTDSGVVEISVASPICCVSYPGMSFLSFPSNTLSARDLRSGRPVPLPTLSLPSANAGSHGVRKAQRGVLGRSPHLPAADIQYAMRERGKKTVTARQLSGGNESLARSSAGTPASRLAIRTRQPGELAYTRRGSVTLTASDTYSTIVRGEGLYQY